MLEMWGGGWNVPFMFSGHAVDTALLGRGASHRPKVHRSCVAELPPVLPSASSQDSKQELQEIYIAILAHGSKRLHPIVLEADPASVGGCLVEKSSRHTRNGGLGGHGKRPK